MEHGGHTIILNDLLHTDFKNEIENVLSEYPIFDEEYRKILNEKIINHYRFREIGFYSPDKFNYKLYVKLNEILPFYNVMYKKLLKENFDIFNDYNYTETYDGTNGEIAETKSSDETNSTSKNIGTGSDTSNSTTTSEDNSNGTNSNTQTSNSTNENTQISDSTNEIKQEYQKGKRETKNLESDTPQGNTSIANIISGGYLSKFNQSEETNSLDTTTNSGSSKDTTTNSGSNKDTTTNEGTNTNVNTGISETNSSSSFNTNSDTESKSTGNGTINSTRDGITNYIRKVTGYQGRDNIEIFNKYLKSLLNIDLLIIKELEELFFMFY